MRSGSGIANQTFGLHYTTGSPDALKGALQQLCSDVEAAVKGGCEIVILSDRQAEGEVRVHRCVGVYRAPQPCGAVVVTRRVLGQHHAPLIAVLLQHGSSAQLLPSLDLTTTNIDTLTKGSHLPLHACRWTSSGRRSRRCWRWARCTTTSSAPACAQRRPSWRTPASASPRTRCARWLDTARTRCAPTWRWRPPASGAPPPGDCRDLDRVSQCHVLVEVGSLCSSARTHAVLYCLPSPTALCLGVLM